MCGIAGWISYDQPIEPGILEDMRDVLAHRGPDGVGLWQDDRRCVGLAHRRLSIIDLSTIADQPMLDIDRRAVIVFNGEIYNHRYLRKELEQAGCRFNTDHSDTECLLQGYLTWGIDRLLEKAHGQFAFAIFDIAKRRLILVRDRVGIKPLYVAKVNGGFVFASEIKAILKHPQISPALDRDAFRHHLSFRSVAPPKTLFQGIECLGPSELIEIDVDRATFNRRTWWDPCANAASPPATLLQARERLEELLHQSVIERLESDVPVGLFLSGGLDSALLLQLIKDRLHGLGTYTIGYPGHQEYDESSNAADLAKKAGSEHYPVNLTPADFVESIARVAYHQDEPIAAPVCTSVYFLAREARRTKRKVVLAGEGSDEIFMGYRTWIQTRDMEKWNRMIPALPGRPIRRLTSALLSAVSSSHSRPAEIVRRIAAGQPLFWGGGLDFTSAAKQELIGPQVDDTYDAVVEPIYQQFLRHGDRRDTALWMSYIDLRFRLPQLMLPRMDKMGMAFSIEGRVPFLDHRIIEFVFGLPAEWRGKVGRESKPLLKSVARKYLPDELVDRRKQGFQAPVREWKNAEFGRAFLPLLTKFAARTELFDLQAIQHLTRQKNDRLYFSLVNFMLWYVIFIENVLQDSLSLPDFTAPQTLGV